jgi:hypothetical protein
VREREQEKAGSALYVPVLTISILEGHAYAWRSSPVSLVLIDSLFPHVIMGMEKQTKADTLNCYCYCGKGKGYYCTQLALESVTSHVFPYSLQYKQ